MKEYLWRKHKLFLYFHMEAMSHGNERTWYDVQTFMSTSAGNSPPHT